MADGIDGVGTTFGLGNAAGISFSGVASGLDTEAIIAALTQLEHKPVDIAKSKQQKTQALVGLVKQLSAKLQALRDKIAPLATLSSGIAYTVASSDAAKATAAAGPGATPGAFSLAITQLASAESEYATAKGGVKFADADTTTLGTGNIDITYAGTSSGAIDVTGLTLNQAVEKINGLGLGVTASAVNVGTAASPDYRLVLSGKETGASKSISVAVDAGVDLAFTEITAAKNAQFSVNGLAIERESNTVGDVVSGVTFTLLGPTATGSALTMTVAPDVTAVKKRITDFVDAYNDVVKLINQNNTYNSATKVAGAFFGDSTIGSVLSRLRDAVFSGGSTYATGDEFSTLSALGIRLQSDGTLQVDDAKLTERLSTDVSETLDLFADTDGDAGPDQGLAVVFRQLADALTTGGTDSSGVKYVGVLDAKVDALNKQISVLQQSIDSGEQHVLKFQQQLKAKYAAFESAIGQLKAQQAALLAKFPIQQ